MKKSKFTEEQIAFALKQAEAGTEDNTANDTMDSCSKFDPLKGSHE